MLSFGLSIIVIISFTSNLSKQIIEAYAPGLFWLMILFVTVLGVHRSYAYEKEFNAKIAEQKEDVDLSNSNRILMQDMDRQEVRDLQQENIQDDFLDDAAMSSPPPNQEDGGIDTDSLPSLDRGGIVSGPDSGYLAVLHGDEAVIPLDNNYTQGEPSAVGDKPCLLYTSPSPRDS